LEAALLGAGALACGRSNIALESAAVRPYLVIVVTAMAMGLRTATARRLGVPDITTTAMTSTLAAFAGESSLAGGSNLRMGRRVSTVLCMLSGAAIGALLLRFGLAVPLISGAVLVLAAASAYARASSASSRSVKENT
jgi:uncharacterized membrane protein YoaK (UPF0700 family)